MPDPKENLSLVHHRMRHAAEKAQYGVCRRLAEHLVRDRAQPPSLQIYNALVLSNCDHEEGAAWRVADLLQEMVDEGITPDVGTCHAVLKVLSVHLDHLMQADILEYMRRRWFTLSEDGWHDVTAALFRSGLFEQALERLHGMQEQGMTVAPWLYDMAIFMLCDAGEVEEAFRIVRFRYNSGDTNIRRGIWAYLLDKGSTARHHRATSLVWTSQVNQGYLNPSSGVCLNVLATAAHAGDATMATEVFKHLSKRGNAFQPIHYELLISAYLAMDPPDVFRAISILTIMPLEKHEPTVAQTRSIYLHLRDKPDLVHQALTRLRDLHTSGRKIPIAALNLLIECYAEQGNLAEAMKIYKQIHTFAPLRAGVERSFANIDTYNLLLKACRLHDPPDDRQASFLVSELLALHVIPTTMTYDRLMLVFTESAKYTLARAGPDRDDSPARRHGLDLLDWSFRHFTDMRQLGWMPRFGTLSKLAVELAKVGDERCWDVLQAAEDNKDDVGGFVKKGQYTRRDVEIALEEFHARDEGRDPPMREDGGPVGGGLGDGAVAGGVVRAAAGGEGGGG
jgi:pentatricopeptide repeat protein